MVIAISGMSGSQGNRLRGEAQHFAVDYPGSQVATSRCINLHLIDAPKEEGE
jgi:hypothetical protein